MSVSVWVSKFFFKTGFSGLSLGFHPWSKVFGLSTSQLNFWCHIHFFQLWHHTFDCNAERPLTQSQSGLWVGWINVFLTYLPYFTMLCFEMQIWPFKFLWTRWFEKDKNDYFSQTILHLRGRFLSMLLDQRRFVCIITPYRALVNILINLYNGQCFRKDGGLRHWYRCGVRVPSRSNRTHYGQEARLCRSVSLGLCCPDAKPRRWAPPLATRFGVIPRFYKYLISIWFA